MTDRPDPRQSPEPVGKARHGEVQPGLILNGIYRVERAVARGGMGQVFEGTNVETEERVAIKVVHRHLASDGKVQAMFRKEARILTQLSHPAIAHYRVLARDPVVDMTYIVTDFIEGRQLLDLLNGQPAPMEDIQTLGRRLTDGLDAAHAAGAIHRDISPDNILIGEGGIGGARIIDFGIARDLAVGAETVIGDGFAGKIGYVAPEQFGDFGRSIGPWTDVYSLALVLMAFARGKAPDMGSSLAEAVERRRTRPDLTDVPDPLRPLFSRMLTPDPRYRMGTMSEVRAALDQIRASTPRKASKGGATGAGRAKPPQPIWTRLWKPDPAPSAKVSPAPVADLTVFAPVDAPPAATPSAGAEDMGGVKAKDQRDGPAPKTGAPGEASKSEKTDKAGKAGRAAKTAKTPKASKDGKTGKPSPAARLGGRYGAGMVVLAALLAGGVGLAWMKGAPRPAPSTAADRPVTMPSTGGDGASMVEISSPDLGCAWLDWSARQGDGATLVLRGAAGDPAAANEAAMQSVQTMDVGAATVDSTGVLRLDEGQCLAVDSLRKFRAIDSHTVPTLRAEQASFELTTGAQGCPVGTYARPVVTAAPADPSHEFALLAILPSGRVRLISANRNDLKALGRRYPDRFGDVGNGGTRITLCENAKGVMGVAMVEAAQQPTLGLKPGRAMRATPDWASALAKAGRSEGWSVRTAWFSLTDIQADPAQPAAAPERGQDAALRASSRARPLTPTPSIAPARTEEGDTAIAAAKRNPDFVPCRLYDGHWRENGYASLSVCIARIFQGCSVQSGQSGDVALRRYGGRIEAMGGKYRRWTRVAKDECPRRVGADATDAPPKSTDKIS